MEIVGVDPGVVHTGVVSLFFDPVNKTVYRQFAVFDGIKPDEIKTWIATHTVGAGRLKVYIEKYEPRSIFDEDVKMIEGQALLKQALPKANLVSNFGVNSIIKAALLQQLECWKFGVATHHNDLRSAAKIALYGAVKDEHFNPILYRFVDEQLNGVPWKVLT